MGLTTGPPGPTPGVGPADVTAPVVRELRALVDELRVLAGAGSAARPLPPLPELRGAAPEPALARWFRSVLEAGSTPPPALRTLVDQAVERLTAGAAATGAGAAPEPRPLDGARDAALRLLAAAAAEVSAGRGAAPAPASAPGAATPVDRALALRVLAEEVRRAVVAEIGTEPPFVAAPAAAEDPGNAGAALLGWLRTAAARAGVPLESLAPAIEAGAERAQALLPGGSGSTALAAALDAARDVIGRGLDAARDAAPRAGVAPVAVLVAEIANAVSEALGPGAALARPPATVPDPGHAAEALVGWLRGDATRAGASPALLAEAVDVGAERALTALAGADPAARAAVETVRGWIGRGLAGGAESPPSPLYRPDLPVWSAASAGRTRGRRGDRGDRVPAIGEDERPPPSPRGPPARGRPGAEDEPASENPTEGPMQCIRRCLEALFAGDTAAFTAEWVYPACFWIDGRWFACVDEAALGAFQGRLLRARRERGVVGGRVLLLRVDPVSESAALAHALVSEERSDGGPAREVESLYTTVRTGGGWRVASAIAK